MCRCEETELGWRQKEGGWWLQGSLSIEVPPPARLGVPSPQRTLPGGSQRAPRLWVLGRSLPRTQATGGQGGDSFGPASRDTPPTCRHAYTHTHTPDTQTTHPCNMHTHRTQSHTRSGTHANDPDPPYPSSRPGAHSGGQPASLLPPVPNARPGGVSVPLPGRHMWFQLAAERAFPSQTAGPCQGPCPTGARKKVHLGPHSSTGHPSDPGGPSPLEDPAPVLHGLPLTWSRNPRPLSQGPAVPGLQPCPPASWLLLCLEQAERDGRRAGCQGRAGGRGGGVWK